MIGKRLLVVLATLIGLAPLFIEVTPVALAATPEYRIPCHATNTGNWKTVRERKGLATDQQLLDDINVNGRRAHKDDAGNTILGQIDLNDNVNNTGPRTYGICNDKSILIAREGTVTFNGGCTSNGCEAGGWSITVTHDDGQRSRYAHMRERSALVVGQRYAEGTVAGTMGDTGNTTGIHLHFGVNNSQGSPTIDYLFKNPFGDTSPPTGGYTEPANDTVACNSVMLRGNASDDLSGVDRVEFTAHYDGSWHPVYADYSAPYEYDWNISSIADQPVTLGFDVFDKAGNIARSPQGTRAIRKTCNRPPTAPTLVAPADSSTITTADVTLQWQAAADPENDQLTYAVEIQKTDGSWDLLQPAPAVTSYSAKLPGEGEYQWCVLVTDKQTDGVWSPTWTFTYRQPPVQPDLQPYAPAGYQYPVVPSSVQRTHEVNTLYAGQPTYFDWYFINNSTVVAPGPFYAELWVDDVQYARYPQPDFGPNQVGGHDDWKENILTPGPHTVRIVVDPDNQVAESDETNNVWEQTFTWVEQPGTFTEKIFVPIAAR